jgi:hypothetical protein
MPFCVADYKPGGLPGSVQVRALERSCTFPSSLIAELLDVLVDVLVRVPNINSFLHVLVLRLENVRDRLGGRGTLIRGDRSDSAGWELVVELPDRQQLARYEDGNG